MKNELLIRGIVLIAISLFFGIPATSYQVGTFSRAGPGLFPLLVSCIVGLIGLVMVVRAWFEKSAAMTFNFRNILIVLASLVGFVLMVGRLAVQGFRDDGRYPGFRYRPWIEPLRKWATMLGALAGLLQQRRSRPPSAVPVAAR